MTTLQITLPDKIKNHLNKRTKNIGISNTAYVKILIASDLGLLTDNEYEKGNLFNADRDNDGIGIEISNIKKMLKT